MNSLLSIRHYMDIIKDYEVQLEMLNDKKKSCEKLLPKLSELSLKLTPISDKLIEGESKFLSGGFVSDDEPYDRGVLKECYGIINNDSTIVTSLIDKVNKELADVELKIQSMQTKLNEAKINYAEALAKESQGEQ